MRRVLAGLIGCALAGGAHAAALDGLDFVVDARKYEGQTVEVRPCYINVDVGFFLSCEVHNDRGTRVGSIYLDKGTMNREDLRTSLTRCMGNKELIPFCRVSVVGRVKFLDVAGSPSLENTTIIVWETN
jgi:hypothetical protein